MPPTFNPCLPRLGHSPAAAIMQSGGTHVIIAVAARAAALLFCFALLQLQGSGITRWQRNGASASTRSVSRDSCRGGSSINFHSSDTGRCRRVAIYASLSLLHQHVPGAARDSRAAAVAGSTYSRVLSPKRTTSPAAISAPQQTKLKLRGFGWQRVMLRGPHRPSVRSSERRPCAATRRQT